MLSGMIIATWNVNSIRVRLPRLLAWLDERKPDVLCMQETKVVDEQFPRAEIEAAGYAVEFFGQKTYNGVAIASRLPFSEVSRGLPGDGPEDQKRLIEATVADADGRTARVIDVYVPNGQSPGTDAFAKKLDWLARLRGHLDAAHSPDQPLVLLGDMNIAPDDRDVYDPEALRETIHCSTPERQALADVLAFGLHDALRLKTSEAGQYTWWDYRAAMFRRGLGLRIDLILVTAPLADRLVSVEIDRRARAGEKPSDHAPVLATFA